MSCSIKTESQPGAEGGPDTEWIWVTHQRGHSIGIYPADALDPIARDRMAA
jgi:hypothetical protein